MSEQPPRESTVPSPDNPPATAHRPMQFRFISGLDNSYSKPVRAHVLQRHMRERRLRAERKERRIGRPDDIDDLVLVRRKAKHVKRSNAVTAPAAGGRGHAAANQPVPSNSNSLVRYVGPASLLNQGAVDPFQSTASGSMTATEDLLVDYC